MLAYASVFPFLPSRLFTVLPSSAKKTIESSIRFKAPAGMSSVIVPEWVRSLVDEHDGFGLSFIMAKSLTSSDLDVHRQNRLLIPLRYVKANLIPILSEAEKAAASLLHPPGKGNVPSSSRAQGRIHGGLKVRVYSRSKFWFNLMLTRWDTTGSTVIKGMEYKYFLDRSFFQKDDEVEMWSFREGKEGKLCFALGLKTK